MEDKIDLSLVIACYNEAAYLKESIYEVFKVLDATKFTYEIIFVDDASRDTTRDIIGNLCREHPNMRYLFHSTNEGRGKAVSDGIKIARGSVAGFIDIDLETHARYISSFVAEVLEGADVVCAWRIYKTKLLSFDRWVLNRGYNFLVRNFLGIPLRDTEAGFKFFNRQKILPLLEKTKDKHWFWDTEIMARAYFGDLRIIEVPTLYIRKKDKKSTVKILRDTMYYFKKLFRFKHELKKLKQHERKNL